MSNEDKTNEELIEECIELNKEKASIETDLGLLKSELEERMAKAGVNSFQSELGEARLINGTHRHFSQDIAKKYLTPEQVKECQIEKPLKYVRVVDNETKEVMQSFIDKK